MHSVLVVEFSPVRSLFAGKYFDNQGSRLTFQLSSPVASDRFYSLAKTKFSLARSIIASSQVNATLYNLQYHVCFERTTNKYKVFMPLILTEPPSKPPKNIFFFQITDSRFKFTKNNLFGHLNSIRCKHIVL